MPITFIKVKLFLHHLEFNKVQPYCEHCNAESKHHEQVTPRLLSRGQFL